VEVTVAVVVTVGVCVLVESGMGRRVDVFAGWLLPEGGTGVQTFPRASAHCVGGAGWQAGSVAGSHGL
jgi:hypothetical protein